MIGKKVLANIGIRSQKTMGPHLTNSPKIKSNLCSIQTEFAKNKEGWKIIYNKHILVFVAFALRGVRRKALPC